jgi:hypothetical protein
MTLHEAIIEVLTPEPAGLTAAEIARRINLSKSYVRGDKKPIPGGQISARVNNYPQLFIKNGQQITLNRQAGVATLPKRASRIQTPVVEAIKDSSLLQKMLMNEKNFKAAGAIDGMVPSEPGLYCIRIRDIRQLSAPFRQALEARQHNIIYIGIASQSLATRFLGQELRARGHGTFFRSIGAVLGFRPERGSLLGKRNQNNYTFSAQDKAKIIAWINENLLVNWVPTEEDLHALEHQMLKTYLPLLNIAGNPGAMSELCQLRDNCKQIARGSR